MSGLQYYRKEKFFGLDASKPLFADLYLSGGAGKSSDDVASELRRMLAQASTAGQIWRKSTAGPPAPSSVVEQLYQASAEIKVAISRVAMHLADPWRRDVFAQIDRLLDMKNWHDEDVILKPASFQTYLRFFLDSQPTRQPSLGVSDSGNLLAGWVRNRNRLSIEFLPIDEVRWVLVKYLDDERESAAAQVPLVRLGEVLAPYDAATTWWA
jgi:hypothetical protein